MIVCRPPVRVEEMFGIIIICLRRHPLPTQRAMNSFTSSSMSFSLFPTMNLYCISFGRYPLTTTFIAFP